MHVNYKIFKKYYKVLGTIRGACDIWYNKNTETLAMKTTTKDFIHARGMNSDAQTVKMLHREAKNILKAEEIYDGAFRITMITGEERIINDDELEYLRDLCQDHVDHDFDIYFLNGDVSTAVV